MATATHSLRAAENRPIGSENGSGKYYLWNKIIEMLRDPDVEISRHEIESRFDIALSSETNKFNIYYGVSADNHFGFLFFIERDGTSEFRIKEVKSHEENIFESIPPPNEIFGDCIEWSTIKYDLGVLGWVESRPLPDSVLRGRWNADYAPSAGFTSQIGGKFHKSYRISVTIGRESPCLTSISFFRTAR